MNNNKGKEQNNKVKSRILMRIGLLFVGFVLFGFVIIGQVIYLNIFDRERLIEKSKSITYKDTEILPVRGDIRSADGKLMATTVTKYDIRMDTKNPNISNEDYELKIDSLSEGLSKIFKNKTKKEYKSYIDSSRKQGNRYLLLKRNITFSELKAVKKLPILRRGKNAGGLIVESKSKREKPFGILSSRTIGFLVDDKEGRKMGYIGLERAFEKELKGEKGVQTVRKLSGGRKMPIEELVQAVDGADIITTIDMRFQDIVENELLKAVKKYRSSYGTAVLMEVETGKIKAIANIGKNKVGNYTETYNYAVGRPIEPGSTFKLASMMVALEDGVVKLTDTIDVEGGRKKYYDRWMEDDHMGGQFLTVQQIFESSSNVGVSKMIVDNYKNDPRKYTERLYGMNLNAQTGIGIKGEKTPLIKYPDDATWSGVTLPWMSIGYELHLTPLQILNFYNAVANNGKMVKPYLVSEIQKHGKVIKRFDTEVVNASICSKETVAKAQKILKGVVENGTADNIKNKYLSLAGKTGTAQIANESGGYKNQSGVSYNVSFAGYFPAENPKYSCIVMLSKPKGIGRYGRTGAAPVFKNIAMQVYVLEPEMIKTDHKKAKRHTPYQLTGFNEDIVEILRVGNYSVENNAEKSTWVSTSTKDTNMVVSSRYMASGKMPDVRGLGLRDALFILENAGLTVKVYGTGKVHRQSIPAGANCTKGQRIVLQLS